MGRIEKDKSLSIVPFFLCSYLSLSLPWEGAALGMARPASLCRQLWILTLLGHVQRCQQIQRRWIRCFKEVQRALNLCSLINA